MKVIRRVSETEMEPESNNDEVLFHGFCAVSLFYCFVCIKLLVGQVWLT